ncbi:hypothetical protein BC937DRAFT_94985 [Endogone sp. FLAS-F59071]|nr:hypothetical protein BC937DRAFT_94985 [Endogone sp. FLAS-F59071]|eukprot:RUS20536.1 hypothetical protein BC937DRAFT_94985 [Endogone sp. FLAS-F59071]
MLGINRDQPRFSIGATADVDLDQVRQTIETNVLGILATSQAVIPGMVAQGGGRIVNVGSVVGFVSTPWAGIYSMTKAAVHSLSDTMRIELKPFNIDVIVLAPGCIKSNIYVSAGKSVIIPSDSLYRAAAHHIRARAAVSQAPKATPTDVFARRAVAAVLRSHPPRYFTYGHLSLLFVVCQWLPRAVTEFILGRILGVGEIKQVKIE